MALLELQSVSQRFGGLHALRNVNMVVEEGQIVGIIGPNGAGKSTLFNTIAGVTPAVEGSIRFDQRDVTKCATYDIARLGLVKTSQTVQVFSDLSVLDNVVVGAILHTSRVHEAKKAAYEQLEFMGLQDVAHVRASELTLANRARLELARALALKPRVLMVDELMAGMTEIEVSETLRLLQRINRERQVTLLVIEHNMRAIMHLSHRIIALIQGMVVADGDPVEVSRNPTVVESYLGVV